MVRLIFPVFWSVTFFGLLVMPTVWFPKFRLLEKVKQRLPARPDKAQAKCSGRKFASPLYVAVMPCVPTDRVEVVKVATPLLLRSEFANVRRSVVKTDRACRRALQRRGVVTVAVNVTDCPRLDGLSDETSAVVVNPGSY